MTQPAHPTPTPTRKAPPGKWNRRPPDTTAGQINTLNTRISRPGTTFHTTEQPPLTQAQNRG